jgi:beta-lactamase superfamily II metal-dependent hydrolase
VIDGGWKEDADYLKSILKMRGNHVAMWFISHTHSDHVDALTAILHNPGQLKIDRIYASLLDDDWMREHGLVEENEPKTLAEFKEAARDAHQEITELQLGQVLKIDGLTIEILGVKNPEIVENGVNNSSVVMRMSDAYKSILFPGDLGVEGGEKLLHGEYKDRLKSDYVQMAHHGQNGVDKAFYQAVAPKYCLWPTPKWLWDNDMGGGPGTGPWVTQEVRNWMDELGVKKHYCQFDGLQRIQCDPPDGNNAKK